MNYEALIEDKSESSFSNNSNNSNSSSSVPKTSEPKMSTDSRSSSEIDEGVVTLAGNILIMLKSHMRNFFENYLIFYCRKRFGEANVRNDTKSFFPFFNDIYKDEHFNNLLFAQIIVVLQTVSLAVLNDCSLFLDLDEDIYQRSNKVKKNYRPSTEKETKDKSEKEKCLEKAMKIALKESDDSFLEKYIAIDKKNKITDVVSSFKHLRLNADQNNVLCRELAGVSKVYNQKFRFLFFHFKNVYSVLISKMQYKSDVRYSALIHKELNNFSIDKTNTSFFDYFGFTYGQIITTMQLQYNYFIQIIDGDRYVVYNREFVIVAYTMKTRSNCGVIPIRSICLYCKTVQFRHIESDWCSIEWNGKILYFCQQLGEPGFDFNAKTPNHTGPKCLCFNDSSVTCFAKSVRDFEIVTRLINEPRGTGVQLAGNERRGLKRAMDDNDSTVPVAEKVKKTKTTIQNNIESMCKESTTLNEETIKQICSQFMEKLREENKVILVPKHLTEIIDLTDDDKENDVKLQIAIANANQINVPSEPFNQHMVEHLKNELKLKNCGIVNMGQTCYLSAVVQVLKLIPEMESREDELIVSELKHIYKRMNEKKEACDLENLLVELASINNIYSNKMEANDADECLQTLLHVLALDSVSHFITEKRSCADLTEMLERQAEKCATQFIFCALDRVEFDRVTRKLKKHTETIEFPKTFGKYKLIAIISYWGESSTAGHNMAYVCNAKSQWILYDDVNVSQLSDCDYLISNNLLGKEVFVLLYERVSL